MINVHFINYENYYYDNVQTLPVYFIGGNKTKMSRNNASLKNHDKNMIREAEHIGIHLLVLYAFRSVIFLY